MKRINIRYENDCRKCGARLNVGAEAIHEKHVGIFCLPCEPTDREEIRSYRTEAAEKRAQRYDGWAKGSHAKAAELEKQNAHFTGDIAFFTQPGRFTERTRYQKRSQKAYEHATQAQQHEQKAASLRNVRVKGDAAERDEAKRESVRQWIKPGMMVDTVHCGVCEVLKVNKKTAKFQGSYGAFNHDLMFCRPVKTSA